MKILIVNRNYFVTGGPEKYMFSLMESMPEHEFIPFCVDFAQNEETPYRSYFVHAPGGRDNIYFHRFNMSFVQKASFAMNMVYSFSMRKKLEKLIKETRPDAALFLNAAFFSDSILDACQKYHVPVLWRLSDFSRICANYLLYNNGQICEACIKKGLGQILKNRCGGYQKSYMAALVKYMGMTLSSFRKVHRLVNFFITPSEFTRRKMIQAGVSPEKLIHIPTFVRVEQVEKNVCPDPNGVLYAGRLSPEKGVAHLIQAFGLIKNKKAVLTIAGDTGTDYAEELLSIVPDGVKNRVFFVGFKSPQGIYKLFLKNLFFVVPSLWYENQPNVVLEGMAAGRAALVSKSGSLTEMVTHGETGYHFQAANPRDLAIKIDAMFEAPDNAVAMGRNARRQVLANHSQASHLKSLNELLSKAIQTDWKRKKSCMLHTSP